MASQSPRGKHKLEAPAKVRLHPARALSGCKTFAASLWVTGLGLAALLWLTGSLALAGEQNQPSAVESNTAGKAGKVAGTEADDPFAPANQVKDGGTQTGPATEVHPKATRRGKPSPIDQRIEFEMSIAPTRVRRGEVAQLTVTGTPRPGFHTYPLTQRSADPAQDPSQLSTLTYGSVSGVQPLWPVVESDPQPKLEEGVGWFLEHEHPFTWKQDILILPGATPGEKTLPVTIQAQVCNASNCVVGEPQFEVKFEVSGESPVPLTPALRERIRANHPELRIVPLSGPAATGPAAIPRTVESKVTPVPDQGGAAAVAAVPKGDASGLVAFILQGIGWGAISLLTPCVFPMIPITVSFFLKQSEKQHHNALGMALVYSATIVLVLTAGAVLLLRFFQELSQYGSTNLVLGCLFLFFALSLFGMYEIRLPTTLANFTSARESRGGLLGTVFMALTFTIISFTCVAPFLGGFAGINVQSRAWYEIVLGGLAFSVTFAAPFFLLALFPTLLRQMPKSGSWMNALKVVMGFLELAAALKFLRAAELLSAGRAQFLTYDFVLGMYIALAILCGLYLLGLYRLPHDHDVPEHLGVPRLLFSLVFLSLAFYLMPALFKHGTGEPQRPTGTVFAWLDAFLLPEPPEIVTVGVPANSNSAEPRALSAERSPVGTPDSAPLAWVGNLQKGLQIARDQGRLVFIDFTGLT
jgi:thiol:disulfide interchange protein DsbD